MTTLNKHKDKKDYDWTGPNNNDKNWGDLGY